MIGVVRTGPDARIVIQPESPPFWPILWHLDPFFIPYPPDPFMVYPPSIVLQQGGDPSLSIPPILTGELNDSISENPNLQNGPLYGWQVRQLFGGIGIPEGGMHSGRHWSSHGPSSEAGFFIMKNIPTFRICTSILSQDDNSCRLPPDGCSDFFPARKTWRYSLHR